MQLGVAGLGASPSADGAVSVFRDDGGNAPAETMRVLMAGPRGAVYALLDTSPPSLYLPLGTCEAAARRLPVRWHAGLERYLWDTAGSRYGRLIASPDCFGLVLHTSGGAKGRKTAYAPTVPDAKETPAIPSNAAPPFA